MNGLSSSNLSPDYNRDIDRTPDKFTGKPSASEQQDLSAYKPGVSPNGFSLNGHVEVGGTSFNPHEYEMHYHLLFVVRRNLKEARRDYHFTPTSNIRNLVHKQELRIVAVCTKLLRMRRHLLRESLNYTQEVLEFCLNNPTVSDWLKAVGIQAPRLIECIKSQFDSIENLLGSDKQYLLELLIPHNIHEIEKELFMSSWEILQSYSSPELHNSISRHYFSWTECFDRLRSQETSKLYSTNDSGIETTFTDLPRRVPSPDPWNKSPYAENRSTLASVSDCTSISDPNLYPFTPSPGASNSQNRIPNISSTFPRRHPKPSPDPDSVQLEPLPDKGDTYSEDESYTQRTFFGTKLLRRLFRKKNRDPCLIPNKGSRTSLIIEYKQEPRAPRYRNPVQASPDYDFGSQLRLQTQLHDEVFVDEVAPSPSFPSDTAKTDGSASPLHSPSPQPTDWEINFREISKIKEIKSCKFSSLSTGNWHGQILLKTYKSPLHFVREQFLQELNALRNIRHDNVILFLGACTSDPDLTIVTSVKHAPTLHHVIRLSPKHPLDRALTILKEISQAMTYLHDRKIVHQNLNTDTIYLERGNARPILFDIAINPLLEYAGADPGSWEFPRCFVSSLAPEIIDSLSPAAEEFDRIPPFSDKSDVFAFGSIWYELYTGQYPLQGDPIEVVLFKVSNGVRQTLDLIIGSRGIKEELCRCWNRDPHKRPSFQNLEGIVEKLPNLQLPKRIGPRSTSHTAVMPLKSSEATM